MTPSPPAVPNPNRVHRSFRTDDGGVASPKSFEELIMSRECLVTEPADGVPPKGSHRMLNAEKLAYVKYL
jgi:hypothetical protein